MTAFDADDLPHAHCYSQHCAKSTDSFGFAVGSAYQRRDGQTSHLHILNHSAAMEGAARPGLCSRLAFARLLVAAASVAADQSQ